jgi:hypothetical protein
MYPRARKISSEQKFWTRTHIKIDLLYKGHSEVFASLSPYQKWLEVGAHIHILLTDVIFLHDVKMPGKKDLYSILLEVVWCLSEPLFYYHIYDHDHETFCPWMAFFKGPNQWKFLIARSRQYGGWDESPTHFCDGFICSQICMWLHVVMQEDIFHFLFWLNSLNLTLETL